LLAAEGEELDAVAGHLLRTEPLGASETIATLRQAASHALTLGTPDNAATYLSRALEEGPERELRTTVLLELGLAEKLARHPAAIGRFEEVRRIANEPTARGTAMVEQAETLAWVGEWQQAVALLDGALADLQGEGPISLRADAMRAASTVARAGGWWARRRAPTRAAAGGIVGATGRAEGSDLQAR
jgi:hypothetical protein